MFWFKPYTKDNIFRFCLFALLQAFNLVSLIYYTIAYVNGTAMVTKIVYCVGTALYLCIADVMQRVCKFRIPTLVYVCIQLYAVAPMLGHTYELYYYVTWWDKLLHIIGGIVFAMFGAYLPKLILKDDRCNVWLCILSGFMFSLGVSVLWEFIEFFCDSVLKTDMQKDRMIFEIHSYLLNDKIVGATSGVLLNLGEVVGTVIQLPGGETIMVSGYLDIGLLDTMLDMLVEAAGALVYCVAYVIDKGKNTSLHYLVGAAPIQQTPDGIKQAETPETEAAISDGEGEKADKTATS